VFAGAGADPDTSTGELQSYETVPSDTTGEKPLIVVVAPQQQQQFREAPPAGKRQKFLSC